MSPGYRTAPRPHPVPSRGRWVACGAMTLALGLVGIASPATAVAKGDEKSASRSVPSSSGSYYCISGPKGILGLLGGLLGADRGCPSGPPGPPGGGGGITGYEVRTIGTFNIGPGEDAFGIGFCPEGKRPLSGGVRRGGGLPENLRLTYSHPGPEPTQWQVGVINEGDSQNQGDFYVICANVAD